MIARKLKLTSPLNYNTSEELFTPVVTTLSELSRETDEFLSDHFRGAYVITSDHSPSDRAAISISAYSIILRKIMAEIVGKSIISISIKSSNGYAQIEFSYSDHTLSSATTECISELAAASLATVEFFNSSVLLKIKLTKAAISGVRANSNKIIYNTLLFWFSKSD